jgi:uncharacterized membrane protein YhaH (DUF805 family)
MNLNVDFKWLMSNSEGRIHRAGYWHALLETLSSCVFFVLIFGAGLKLVQGAYLAISGNRLPFDTGFNHALWLFAGWNIESLAAITIKRLHDRNKSGWWIVPFIIAPFLLYRPSDWLDNPTLALLVDGVGISVIVWCLVELCLSGTRGPNRFGSEPLVPRKRNWVEPSKIEFTPPSVGPPPAWLVKRGHESAAADQCSRQ